MRVGYSVGLVMLSALFTALSGCQDLDTCTDPGRVEACPCSTSPSGTVFGARTCLPEQIWGACDCTVDGNDLLDSGMTGVTGGMTGMTTGGVGGMGTGGVGGMTTGGTGGTMTTGGMSGMGTGGMNSADASMDASDTDSGGMAGVGGEPMGPPYAGCTVATVAADCRAGSECLASDIPFLGTALHVCAPACSMADDCPAAEGTFTATLACVSGRCQLDCTVAPFGAARTCPTGMTCTAKGASQYCYDDGV